MSPQTSSRKLTLADIADVREYERGRDEFRKSVMETKRKRRLSFGTIITLMFENRDTMLLQIQEMARVEKLATDDRFKALTFTGSMTVGWHLKEIAWRRRVTLELGGNAAVIVEPDAGDLAAVTIEGTDGYDLVGRLASRTSTTSSSATSTPQP